MADATYQPKIYKKQGGTQLVIASGGSVEVPVQVLTSADTATSVTNFGLTVLQATTTGPTYTMEAPLIGLCKHIAISHTSSGVTHRCVLRSDSTGTQFDSTGGNQITFATSATRSVTIVAQSTAIWKIVGVYSGASIAAARTT